MLTMARHAGDTRQGYRSVRLGALATMLLVLAACAPAPTVPTHSLQATGAAMTSPQQALRETDIARRQAAEAARRSEEQGAGPAEPGLVLTPGGILFDRRSAELSDVAQGHVDRLADFLARHPERSVIIEGHTDNVEGAGLELSQQRADQVRAYLVRQGISPSRLFTAASGQQLPVADNSSASGRQQNRRVEILISDGKVTVR